MNKFEYAVAYDAECIIAHCVGKDLHAIQPRLWHAPSIPTWWGAKHFADWIGLEITKEVAFEHRKQPNRLTLNSRTKVWRVIIGVNWGPMQYAYESDHEKYGIQIATGLGLRKAVQRLLFPQGDRSDGRDYVAEEELKRLEAVNYRKS